MNKLNIPTAIIIAGVIVAGAIVYTGQSKVQSVDTTDQVVQQGRLTSEEIKDILTIKPEDHVLGSLDAKVKIFEYSDYECPFCKNFHLTMEQVVQEYGENGDVAWIYRHFPIESLHPVKAMREAIASECVAKLAGKDAFWEFSKKFFEVTPSNNRTNLDTVLPQIVSELGINQGEFDLCLESGEFDNHINEDLRTAELTGGRGTPWSILVAPGGDMYPINGALPFESVKQLVDLALESSE